MKIGTCGWSGYPESGSKLENYVRAFNVVEINSTFYHLPRKSTAERWRATADKIKSEFEFVVKVPREITHIRKFKGAMDIWRRTVEIGNALRAGIYIFQTAASFVPSSENITAAKRFFKSIERPGVIGWEVRWADRWREDIVGPLFEELDIIHVVDPFRQSYFRKHQPFSYYRIHGFGRPMMYSYKFSDAELERLVGIVKKKDYVLFNNLYMYEDAMRFSKFVKDKPRILTPCP